MEFFLIPCILNKLLLTLQSHKHISLDYRFFILIILVFFSWNAKGQQSSKSATNDGGFTTTSLIESKKAVKPIWLELEFSLEGGFYNELIQLELFSPGAKIFYTTDGSTPNSKSKVYKKPINISKTTIIRAKAYRGKLRSKIVGHTYFINEPETTFPVISLGITPSVLFDPETGLYVKGPNANDSIWKLDGANFWSRKEVKINTEFYETDGDCKFNSISGFRLFGGMSRLFPQKSMTIIARDRYGKKRIRYPVFGKDGLNKYKFLVLRNSGSDWGRSHFRDALMLSLLDDWDIEKQDYRPSHVYLNGKYWGIYNIREKVNRHFIADHAEVNKDSIDLIEHRITLKRGSTRHYRKMLNFLSSNSLSEPENYAYIQSQMDVENFMNYQIAQIYFDNGDAGGNIKFWRPQTPNGRWRWILYDTDWGFGLHRASAYKNNSLAFHTNPDGPSWPNPPWSTFILRKLLENPNFEAQFVTRFADHLNSTFSSTRVIEKIDQTYATLLPEMSRHLSRWNLKEGTWNHNVGLMRKFALNRPYHVRMHLMEKFNTGRKVEVNAITSEGGLIMINELVKVSTEGFKGQYFENYPIHLKAIPNFGHRFSHWEGIELENNLEATVQLTSDKPYQIKAVFEPFNHPHEGAIVINEISANNRNSGDWVELYNYSDNSVNLKDWYFTDSKHFFKLPEIVIGARNYVILCQNIEKFQKEFPTQYSTIGDFEFGLNKRIESLGLFSNDGAFIDSVSYDLAPVDSVFTLSFMLPYLDNSDIENWEMRFGKGTPSSANPYYLESRIKAEQEIWVRVGTGIGLLFCCLLLLKIKRRKAPQT